MTDPTIGPAGSAPALRAALAAFARDVAPGLPLPGGGDTATRFEALRDVGRRDLAVARLAEAHADALAILGGVGRRPEPGATYAVWAARTRTDLVEDDARPDGAFRLYGRKPWASGADIVDRALITTQGREGVRLFDVDLSHPGVRIADRPWVAPAFAGTETATVELDLEVVAADLVGGVDSYLDRAGFWHGAAGVAACWAGGIGGLADRVDRWWRSTPHAAAHRAAVDAAVWAGEVLVRVTAEEIDADPDDLVRARSRARRLRHLVDQAAEEVLRRARYGCGPAPFAHDPDVVRHTAELELYVRQCHAEADLEAAADDLPNRG